MTPCAVYCEEDVHGAVLRGLRRIGADATSAPAEGNLGLDDEAQLLWATTAGRVLLTHNVRDFPRIHYEFAARGESHGGIVVARRDLSIGEIIRRVAHLCSTLSADDLRERLEYLSNW